jgi:hypothetical protein
MSESAHFVPKSQPGPAPREESTVAQAPAGVAWRHVAVFAFLSYAIAWALILPFIPNVFDLISADKTPAELDISIVPVFAMFAPMVAALVMRLFVSKEGLKGSLGPRGVQKLCECPRAQFINSIRLRLGVARLSGRDQPRPLRGPADKSSAFDVDSADLVFARARETNKGESKRAVLRKGAVEASE